LPFALYRRVVRLFTGTRLGELPWIARAHRALMRRLKPSTVEIDGLVLEVDPGDSLGLTLTRGYEEYERALIARIARPGHIALDIGANIGLYTTLLARAVSPSGRVVAFEPEPENFALLRRNVERNRLDNVVLAPVAAAAANTTLRLYRNPSNAGDHRVYDADGSRESVEVAARRLDDFLDPKMLAGRRDVDLVKMDIQGAELAALSGMAGLLRRSGRVILLVELWPWGLRRNGDSAEALLASLADLDFRFWEIDENRRCTRATTAEDLLSRLSVVSCRHTNLVCSRHEIVF